MIYVSTGGFRKLPANQVAADLKLRGIDTIELSGGTFSDTLIEDLQELVPEVKFQVHNYFPPPRYPFVLNLGSLDPEIGALSVAHVRNALDVCTRVGADRYSFHAGFLIDPRVNELGKRIENRDLYDREESTRIFIDRVGELAKEAEKSGIKLMIENNVLSEKNAKEFSGNPLLMCSPEECRDIMNKMPGSVGMLVDVAHLKVSARSLGFSPELMFELCDKWISGYHLSDNNGLEDSNEPISENSWFWPYLNSDVGYFTIEVYSSSFDVLFSQKAILERKLHELMSGGNRDA